MLDICIVTDGKPGHQNQSIGLADALIEEVPAAVVHFQQPKTLWQLFISAVLGLVRRPECKYRLVMGAGHSTHLTILCLGWLHQAKTIVLMKPSLPTRWFDLAIIPQHDKPDVSRVNIVATLGVLNRMKADPKIPQTGLLLIGGPSKHFVWNDDQVIKQIKSLVDKKQDISWLLTTSRRTPSSFLDKLSSQETRVTIFPVESVDATWLPQQLATAEYCWVSEDSVSMVYEALTAGCNVGLFSLESKIDSRVAKGIEMLKNSGRILQEENIGQYAPTKELFNEASRCASIILKKGWL